MLSSCGGDSIFQLKAVKLYLSVNPFSLASLRQAVMPFLLMVRIASVETFSVTHLSSSGMKNLFVWRLGRNLLRVLWLEWETVFPLMGFFPVISQTRAMVQSFIVYFSKTECKERYFFSIKQKIFIFQFPKPLPRTDQTEKPCQTRSLKSQLQIAR